MSAPSLPQELWGHVLSFYPFMQPHDVACLRSVGPLFNSTLQDPSFWHGYVQDAYPEVYASLPRIPKQLLHNTPFLDMDGPTQVQFLTQVALSELRRAKAEREGAVEENSVGFTVLDTLVGDIGLLPLLEHPEDGNGGDKYVYMSPALGRTVETSVFEHYLLDSFVETMLNWRIKNLTYHVDPFFSNFRFHSAGGVRQQGNYGFYENHWTAFTTSPFLWFCTNQPGAQDLLDTMFNAAYGASEAQVNGWQKCFTANHNTNLFAELCLDSSCASVSPVRVDFVWAAMERHYG